MCLNLRKTNEVSVPFAQGIGAASQSSCWVREQACVISGELGKNPYF